MPNILQDLLKQIAVYWEPGPLQEDGERDYSGVTPVELVCHWSHNFREATTPEGEVFNSTATVNLMEEVEINGILWLSSYTVLDSTGSALTEAPASPPMNQIIQGLGLVTDIDGIETHYTAML